MIIYGALDHLYGPSPQATQASPRWPSMQNLGGKRPEGVTLLMAIYGPMAIYAVRSSSAIAPLAPP
jgi:hypothetical protein